MGLDPPDVATHPRVDAADVAVALLPEGDDASQDPWRVGVGLEPLL
jgi:hypothetical protein